MSASSLRYRSGGIRGLALCERLVHDGHDVVGLDNFDPFYARAVKEENLSALQGAPGFSLVEGDVARRSRSGMRSWTAMPSFTLPLGRG